MFICVTLPFLALEKNEFTKKWKLSLVYLYISNQISLKVLLVFKTNGRISSFTSYKHHCCSFFTSWVLKQQKSWILKILKKHPTLGVWCLPLKYFSEFCKFFLGFYKSQYSGTTLVLVEKCLLLMYRLFKNSKNLTFIRVRRPKTLNDAMYIWTIHLVLPKINSPMVFKGISYQEPWSMAIQYGGVEGPPSPSS